MSVMAILRQLVAHGGIAERLHGGFPIEDATGLSPREEFDRLVFQVHGCGSAWGAYGRIVGAQSIELLR